MNVKKLDKYKDLTEMYLLEKKEIEILSPPINEKDEKFLKHIFEECLGMNVLFFAILLIVKFLTINNLNFFWYSFLIYVPYACHFNQSFYGYYEENKKKIKSKKTLKKIERVFSLSCLFLPVPFISSFYIIYQLRKMNKKNKTNELEFKNIKAKKEKKLIEIKNNKKTLLNEIMKNKCLMIRIKEDDTYSTIKEDIEKKLKQKYIKELDFIDLHIKKEITEIETN